MLITSLWDPALTLDISSVTYQRLCCDTLILHSIISAFNTLVLNIPARIPQLQTRGIQHRLLTEMFHIILIAKGKAPWGWCFTTGSSSAPWEAEAGCCCRAGRGLLWAGSRGAGQKGMAASYTAALQPFPMGWPMRYSSSLKPCQRNELRGSFCGLFFPTNTV